MLTRKPPLYHPPSKTQNNSARSKNKEKEAQKTGQSKEIKQRERGVLHTLLDTLLVFSSVIIVAAEAGLYNNREGWKERKTNMRAVFMTGNK